MSGVHILAIESSCDETSASVISNGRILSNVIYTQKIHEQYGGVVPEHASRLHIRHILPVVQEAMSQSGIALEELNAIAYTQAPGLIGALIVGSTFAKGLAWSLNIPTLAIHHMKAHVLANLIEKPDFPFPFLCLTVSGGHTQIVQVDSPYELKVIGETIDDAAGEAFDKSAKMLGLPYPGGPLIDHHASNGNPKRFVFAKPQIEGLNFSFSGVKTSILYFLQAELKKDDQFITNNLNDLCASIQYTIVKILITKLKKAVKETGIQTIALAGGVSANKGLRSSLTQEAQKQHWQLHIPSFEYCTDNAAMIAMAAHYAYLNEEFASDEQSANARGSF